MYRCMASRSEPITHPLASGLRDQPHALHTLWHSMLLPASVCVCTLECYVYAVAHPRVRDTRAYAHFTRCARVTNYFRDVHAAMCVRVRVRTLFGAEATPIRV